MEFEKDALIHSFVGPFTMENKDEGGYMKLESNLQRLVSR